jgi:hypothetical protein
MSTAALSFRKYFGYSILAGVGVYLLMSLYVLFVPGAVVVNRKLTQYFNWFALPGPYFKDASIRTYSDLFVSHKTSGRWSPYRNIQQENVDAYHRHLSYENLSRSRYIRFAAKSFAQAMKRGSNVRDHRSLKELQGYLRDNYLPSAADSVKLLYVREHLNRGGVERDTVFMYEYKMF